jgi:HEAT repeat protein
LGWRKTISLGTTILCPVIVAACFGSLKEQWTSAPYHHLVQSLQSESARTRTEAAVELGVLRFNGQQLSAAIRPLTERLFDTDIEVRKAAFQALQYFGPEAAPAEPVLAQIVKEDSGDLRREAIRILLLIGSRNAESILLDALANPAAELRVQTVEVLAGGTSSAAPFLASLLDLLKTDPDSSVRAAILKALDSIEPNSKRVATAKLEALEDSSASVRKLAATLLRGPGPIPTVPRLRNGLRDPDADMRAAVIQSLGQIGLSDEEVVPALCAALGDSATHNDARNALGQLRFWRMPGDDNIPADSIKSAVPALLSAMKCDDPKARGVVVALLCRMIAYYALEEPPVPKALRAAVPAICDVLRSHPPVDRRYVLVELLNEVPTEVLVPVYRSALGEPNDPGPQTAGMVNPADWQQAIATVAARLGAQDPSMKRDVLLNLLPVTFYKYFLPMLCCALEDEDRQLGVGAFQLVSNIDWITAPGTLSGAVPTTVVPVLLRASENPDHTIRANALITLGHLGKAAGDVVARLRDLEEREQSREMRSLIRETERRISEAGSKFSGEN